MTKSIVTCADCGKREEYDLKPGYPKKYCTECGAIRKALYNNKVEAKAVVPKAEPIEPIKNAPWNRETSIVAQCLTKCVARIIAGDVAVNVDNMRKNMLDSYNYFKENL